MPEKVAEEYHGDPFKAMRRRLLSAVIDRQAEFLLKYRIEGTDLFRQVCLGKVIGNGGKTFPIYVDGEAISKGFRKVIENIKADLGEK